METLHTWADRVADFIEANKTPLFVVIGLAILSKSVKIKIG